MNDMSKPYDIVLYGASGFTGKLCLRYLSNCKDAGSFKFAAAGRSAEKIKSALQEIGAPDIPILTADAQDEAALTKIAKQTKAIITTAGPYVTHGSVLVKVCSENGVHCVDLTGEPLWSRDMQNKHNTAAERTKAILIHGAGFDSIPSDLTTYHAIKEMRKSTSASVGRVTAGFKSNGGLSGGTFATAMIAMEEANDPQKRRLMANPYSLSPIVGKERSAKPFFTMREGARVGSAWLMESANAPVVRKTWGLLQQQAEKGFNYGPDLIYREFMEVPNRFIAGLVSTILFTIAIALTKVTFLRNLAKKYGLQSGDGPSEKVQQNGFYRVTTVAHSTDGKVTTECCMKGQGDPGYLGTSVLLCETALGLVLDYDKLTDMAKRGGHLTAATVFGDALKERFERTGRIHFQIRTLKK